MIKGGRGAIGLRKGDFRHCNYMIMLTSPCVSWNFLDKEISFQYK